jgi:hypothetical protein
MPSVVHLCEMCTTWLGRCHRLAQILHVAARRVFELMFCSWLSVPQHEHQCDWGNGQGAQA